MRTFSYHQNASALRQNVNGILFMVGFEVIIMVILGFVLPQPWNWYVLLAGLLIASAVGWGFTKVFRTRHIVAEDSICFRYGGFELDVPRSAVSGIKLWNGSLPVSSLPSAEPEFDSKDETLYITAKREGLIEVSLEDSLEGQLLWPKGKVWFRRLIFNVDEHERFMEAVAQLCYPTEVVINKEAMLQTISPPVINSFAVVPSTSSSDGEGRAIKITGLRKEYGNFAAVKGIDLAVEPGEVLAFLGSNGAGKTTTIKMMVGLLKPTAGRISICGKDVFADGPAARKNIGYVPDVPLLREGLTAREFLWMVAGLYDMPNRVGKDRTEELLDTFKLSQWGDHLIRGFSLGMKRKVAIMAALIHNPKVLLLDEVTNGLDPRAAREVKDLLLAASQSGTAVFITTHILALAEELAHKVAIIDSGAIQGYGTMEELRHQYDMVGANLEQLFLSMTGEGAEARVVM